MSLEKSLQNVPTEIDSKDVVELRAAILRIQKQLVQAKERTKDLVDATYRGAYDSMLTFGKIANVEAPPKSTSKAKTEIALWHLTDWQGAKKTTSYNSDVMRKRVMEFVNKAEQITNIQRKDHPVKDVVILFGGDMVEGLFNYPAQLHEIDMSLFGQFTTVTRLIVDVVRRALSIYENVTVVAEWGNHGRIGSKRADVPKEDNIDRMCYEMARQLLSEQKRLSWQDCPEDVQRVEIGNYRALLIHGDEVGRNGFASPTAIVQHANRWRSGAYPWEFRDVYVGHYHTHACWPMANGQGSIYQTGSTESDNRYARDLLAASATPSQRLHFIDPIKGRVTAEYKVWLD